jgi:adenylosuccinate lyase
MSKWAILSSYLEKIATDLRILAMEGIDEVSEGFAVGQIGSSSMPHKKNPIGFENVCGISRIMRSYVCSANENIVLWNERDISHSSVERIIFPDAVNLLCYQLVKLNNLVGGMVINYASINNNMGGSSDEMSSHKDMLNNIHLGGSRTNSHLQGRNRHGT